eukprot:GEZU01023754.1.p1 GENE.GEZU01023754.1~~GEZU01023754.1.p1  ORF type:complete len:370 (-),score=67.30 GEZU01023754.1:79-1188(-)
MNELITRGAATSPPSVLFISPNFSLLQTTSQQIMWKRIAVQRAIRRRSSHSVAAIGSRLYVFGGEETPRVPFSNDIHYIDLSTTNDCDDAPAEWKTITPTNTPPKPMLAHTCTPIGNSLFFFGGRDEAKVDLATLYEFDTTNATWTDHTANMDGSTTAPMARSYHTATSLGNKLYVFGGCGGGGRFNDLYEFDTTRKIWRKMPNNNGHVQPVVRGGSTLCGIEETQKLYLFGGFTGRPLGDLFVYDLATEAWVQPEVKVANGASAPEPRSVHVACALGTNIFVFGGEKEPSARGHEGAGLYFGDSWMLDTKTNTWTQVENRGDVPSARGWHAGAALGNDRVAVFGGFDGNTRLDDLYVWRRDAAAPHQQ